MTEENIFSEQAPQMELIPTYYPRVFTVGNKRDPFIISVGNLEIQFHYESEYHRLIANGVDQQGKKKFIQVLDSWQSHHHYIFGTKKIAPYEMISEQIISSPIDIEGSKGIAPLHLRAQILGESNETCQLEIVSQTSDMKADITKLTNKNDIEHLSDLDLRFILRGVSGDNLFESFCDEINKIKSKEMFNIGNYLRTKLIFIHQHLGLYTMNNLFMKDLMEEIILASCQRGNAFRVDELLPRDLQWLRSSHEPINDQTLIRSDNLYFMFFNLYSLTYGDNDYVNPFDRAHTIRKLNSLKSIADSIVLDALQRMVFQTWFQGKKINPLYIDNVSNVHIPYYMNEGISISLRNIFKYENERNMKGIEYVVESTTLPYYIVGNTFHQNVTTVEDECKQIQNAKILLRWK